MIEANETRQPHFGSLAPGRQRTGHQPGQHKAQRSTTKRASRLPTYLALPTQPTPIFFSYSSSSAIFSLPHQPQNNPPNIPGIFCLFRFLRGLQPTWQSSSPFHFSTNTSANNHRLIIVSPQLSHLPSSRVHSNKPVSTISLRDLFFPRHHILPNFWLWYIYFVRSLALVASAHLRLITLTLNAITSRSNPHHSQHVWKAWPVSWRDPLYPATLRSPRSSHHPSRLWQACHHRACRRSSEDFKACARQCDQACPSQGWQGYWREQGHCEQLGKHALKPSSISSATNYTQPKDVSEGQIKVCYRWGCFRPRNFYRRLPSHISWATIDILVIRRVIKSTSASLGLSQNLQLLLDGPHATRAVYATWSWAHPCRALLRTQPRLPGKHLLWAMSAPTTKWMVVWKDNFPLAWKHTHPLGWSPRSRVRIISTASTAVSSSTILWKRILESICCLSTVIV